MLSYWPLIQDQIQLQRVPSNIVHQHRVNVIWEIVYRPMKTNRGAGDMSIGNLNMDNPHLGLKYPKLGLQNVKAR